MGFPSKRRRAKPRDIVASGNPTQRTAATGGRPSLANFVAEGLERRIFLSNYVATTLNVTAADFSALPSPTPSGYQALLGVQLTGYAPGNPEITGTVTFGWYGGATLGTVPVIPIGPDPSFDLVKASITATLDLGGAGTALTSGSYAGGHVIYAIYSGDSFWPATTFTDAEFQALEQPGGSSGGDKVVVGFGAAHKLSVTAGPSNAAVGDIISPAIKVAVLASSGSIDPSFSTTISAAITTTSTGAGALLGTTSATTVDGVATFSNLSVDKSGQYSLTFADTQGDFTASGLFQITGGKLIFMPPPRDGTAGAALKPFVVELVDARNHVITSNSSSVVTLSPISLKANPVISGNSAQLVAGRATFSNLILKNPDFYKLQADDGGDTEMVSSRFKVAGGKLVVIAQPKDGNLDAPIPVAVKILDATGHVETTATSTVVLSLNIKTGGMNAHLGGTTALAFVAGIARFTLTNAPTINAVGTYTFTATEEDTSTGVLAPTNTTTSIETSKFAIAGYKLYVITPPPAKNSILNPIALSVGLKDSHGRPVKTENAAGVVLSLNSSTGTTAAQIGGTTTAPFFNGMAKFQLPLGPTINGAGTFMFTIDETGADPVATEAVTKPFKVVGYTLKILQKKFDFRAALNDDLRPTDAGGNLTIQILDSNGKPVAADPGLPTLQLTLNRIIGDGDIVGTTVLSPVLGEGSIKYPALLDFSRPGTYSLTATAVDSGSIIPAAAVAPVKSSQFKIVDTILTFTAGGPDVAANAPFDVFIGLRDPHAVQFGSESPHAWVGIQLAVADNAPGKLKSTAVGFDTAEGGGASLRGIQFSAPGLYTVYATEVFSPQGSPFDPSNYSVLGTSHHLTFKVRVKPDHLVFTVQPAGAVNSGEPISFAVALEDDNNNILTDLTGLISQFGDSTAPGIVVTATQASGNKDEVDFPPVYFVNGVATVTNLMIITPNLYRLNVQEREFDTTTNTPLFSAGSPLTAKSNVFRVFPTG